MKLLGQLTTLVLLSALTIACSNSKNKKSNDEGPGPKGLSRVDWDQIPAEYNPKKEVVSLPVQGVEKVKVSLFSFSDDVSFRYSSELTSDAADLEIYSVSKDAAPFSGVSMDTDTETKTLNVTKQGSFSCSTQITNRKITKLKGSCYVKLVFVIPSNTQTEFYNVGTLLTKRLYAVSNNELIAQVKRSYDDDADLASIDQFLKSYSEMLQKPSLTTSELTEVLKGMTWTEQKIKALKKLHSYVLDRENLSKMIDNCFTGFDRDEAREAIGL